MPIVGSKLVVREAGWSSNSNRDNPENRSAIRERPIRPRKRAHRPSPRPGGQKALRRPPGGCAPPPNGADFAARRAPECGGTPASDKRLRCSCAAISRMRWVSCWRCLSGGRRAFYGPVGTLHYSQHSSATVHDTFRPRCGISWGRAQPRSGGRADDYATKTVLSPTIV